MEPIIKKALEGGFPKHLTSQTLDKDYFISKENVCDPLFWQALGKACRWEDEIDSHFIEEHNCDCHDTVNGYVYYALRFYEINLTQGWDLAVEYLASIIK